LIHERVIESIVRLLDLKPSDEVLEIGPGLGFLTRRILEHAGKVRAVEVDPALVERLRHSPLAADSRFELIQGDILTVPLVDRLPKQKIKLAANLPYSIATAVLFRIFEWREHFSTLVLMVQKEVADRMTSAPGRKEYGSLSVWFNIHGRVTEKVTVSPEAFFPRPKVRSTVLKIELFPEPLLAVAEWPALEAVLRGAFGQRRKTLGNALRAAWSKHDRDAIEGFLRSQDIDPQRRGETLSVYEFIKLARAARSQSLLVTGNRSVVVAH
jgi:16S rRNA (adenine1518-N6/adenine1519-N6)-dimethyltransferase